MAIDKKKNRKVASAIFGFSLVVGVASFFGNVVAFVEGYIILGVALVFTLAACVSVCAYLLEDL